MLCTQVRNGVSRAVKVLPFSAGKDFDVIFISFDPRDKPETAAAKKTALMDYWSTQNQSSWSRGRGTSDRWSTSCCCIAMRRYDKVPPMEGHA